MTEHPNTRTVAALEKIITDMEYLVNHPRIQQKTWVAHGKTWLPTLRNAQQNLQRDVNHHAITSEAYQGILIALERVGLRLEMRDSTSWGYRWYVGDLKGAYSTRAEALEAALRERVV